MGYDAAPGVQAVILFGGLRPNGQVSGDTWSFLQGDWYNVTALVHGPPARWGAAMTYDAGDGYLFMYGGCRSPPTETGTCPFALADSWGLYSATWTFLGSGLPVPPPPVGPPPPPQAPPVYDGSMTYDAADGYVVLFGGAEGVGNQLPPSSGGVPPPIPDILPLGETVTYSQGVWSPQNLAGPSPRYGAAFVYDPELGTAILYGGTNRTTLSPAPADFNDTWAFSGGAWSIQTTGPGPGPLWDGSMAYDPTSLDLILFGGALPNGIPNGSTWSYSSSGWSLKNSSDWLGTGIAPRWGAATTFDVWDDYILLAGGSSSSGAGLSDVWSWTVGTGGVSYWTELSAGLPALSAPPTRWDPGWTWMSTGTNGFGLLFGGDRCGSTQCTALGDTWEYYGGSWHPRLGAAPPARFGAAMAYDGADGYTVLFGGCGILCPLGDTWIFTSRGIWKELPELIAPSARYFASMSFDLRDNEMILFGGCAGGVGPCPLGDTWSFVHGLWTNLTPTLSLPEPAARFGAASLGSSGFAMLFGGMGASGALHDLWWFWNGSWIPMPTPQGIPAIPVAFAALGFDPFDQELLLFGGCSIGCPIGGFAFAYHFNGTYPIYPPPPPNPNSSGPPPPPPPPVGWTVLPPIPNPEMPPGPLYGTSPIWDPRDGVFGYLLFFGGRGPAGTTGSASEIFIGGSWVNVSSWV